MSYDKLYSIINCYMIAMYSITINNETVYTTDNEYAAFAAYRSYCREFANKPKKITLLDDDALLHAKSPDMMLIDDVDNVTTNDLLKIIMRQLNIDIKDVKRIVKDVRLPLSNSRVGSWTLPSDNRRFTQMHNDELAALLPHLLSYISSTDVGYTADNLKTMRNQLGLTQEQVAKLVGVSGNRQVRRWELGEQDMPSHKWQILLDYFNKNACNRS